MDAVLSQLTDEARKEYIQLMEDKDRLERECATLKGKQKETEAARRLNYGTDDETPIQTETLV